MIDPSTFHLVTKQLFPEVIKDKDIASTDKFLINTINNKIKDYNECNNINKIFDKNGNIKNRTSIGGEALYEMSPIFLES